MLDPYLQSNGTLKNLLGITDAEKVSIFEDRVTTVRQALLNKAGIGGPMDFAQLKRIHRFIFQDVYAWAGKPRICNLKKSSYIGDASANNVFVPFALIPAEADRIFRSLASRDELKGLSRRGFTSAAANLFVDLNNLHPFREGNGRTQRLFLKALAARAGHELAFDVVTRERMISVSIAGLNGDREPARRLFTEISDSVRVASLRKALHFLKSHGSVPWNDLYIATTVAGQEYAGVLVGRADRDFMMKVHDGAQDWIAIGSSDDLSDGIASGDDLTVKVSKFV